MLPDQPTVAEAGVPGYEASQWYGVLAPAQTPKEIITRLHAEIVRILQAPDMRERLAADGTPGPVQDLSAAGQDAFGDGVNCGSAYNTAYMDWADEHGISYLAWWWSVEGEYDEPACLDLITDYVTGEPTAYGAPIRDHFIATGG